MLSRLEKQEILKDARSEKRKIAFRKTLVADSLRSFDAYLKFLNGIHKAFSRKSTPPAEHVSPQGFKL